MSDVDPGLEAAIVARLGVAPRDATPFLVDAMQRQFAELPLSLRMIWRKYGLVSLAGRRLHLLDPARLAPVISYIFEGDPDLAGDVHAIAYGNLGEVVLWSARYGYGFLSPVLSTLEMPNLTRGIAEPPEAQFIQQVLDMPPALIDAYDPARRLVHDRLVSTLGRLPYGTIYGATPVPPPLEGTPVENYVVADVAEWLEAVYTEIAVTLVDWDLTPSDQRRIGQPWPQGHRQGQTR